MREPQVAPLTEPTELARLARDLYVEGPYLMRKLMHYRIHICPFERLIRHVSPGNSVLDVGCGAGLFLALLAGTVPNLRAVGFDSSVPAIKTALLMEQRARAKGLNAEMSFARLATSEPWPSGEFDVVSLVDVMHHIPPAFQKGVFENAAGRVKPGGILLYKDMADRPAFHAGMNRLHDLVLARQWINYVPVARVDEWAQELSLVPGHKESISRLWYQHDLRIYRRPDSDR